MRLSLAGGGTDLSEFYSQEDGAVLSTSIDKYVYVMVKESFEGDLRVRYTQVESVRNVDELRHELVREAMRKTGLVSGLEIDTLGDVPAKGTGLGSSSSVTVGLLNAFYEFLGKPRDPEALAAEACEVEIEILDKPIGKQDQYIAALGGIRRITFHNVP